MFLRLIFRTLHLVCIVCSKKNFVAGPRGSPLEPCSRPPWCSRLPELHQDQHLLLGKDSQAQLQEEEVLDKAPPRGICKSILIICTEGYDYITLLMINYTIFFVCLSWSQRICFKIVVKDPNVSKQMLENFSKRLLLTISAIEKHWKAALSYFAKVCAYNC